MMMIQINKMYKSKQKIKRKIIIKCTLMMKTVHKIDKIIKN